LSGVKANEPHTEPKGTIMKITRTNLRQNLGLGITVAALVIGASACGSDNSADETDVPSTEMVVESQPADAPASNEPAAPTEQETTAPVVAQPAAPTEDDSDHNDIPNASYLDEGSEAVDPAAPADDPNAGATPGSVAIPTIKVPILPTTTMKIPTVLPTVSPTVISNLQVSMSNFTIVKSSPLEVNFTITEGNADIARVEFTWSAPGLTGSGEATKVANVSNFAATWRVGSMLANTTVLRIMVVDVNGVTTTFVKNF
jgi:hypothetical protein